MLAGEATLPLPRIQMKTRLASTAALDGGRDEAFLALSPATSSSLAARGEDFTAYSFTVTRSGRTDRPVSVDWTVTGAGDNPAEAEDFRGRSFPSRTLTFAPGETTKVIVVNVITAQQRDSNERFAVVLSRPVGAALTTARATATIRRDASPLTPSDPPLGPSAGRRLSDGLDGAVVGTAPLSASFLDGTTVLNPKIVLQLTAAGPLNQQEGSDGGAVVYAYNITVSGERSAPLTATWKVVASGVNPANRFDFVEDDFPGGTVTFLPGETTKTIAVKVKSDQIVEGTETFTVALEGPRGVAVRNTLVSSVIITDDFGLDQRGTRLAAGGRWFDLLDPQVRSSIAYYQQPLKLSEEERALVQRFVIAYPNDFSRTSSKKFETFLGANGLGVVSDLGLIYNLPGVSVVAVRPLGETANGPLQGSEGIAVFEHLKRQADLLGYKLWLEPEQSYEPDGPINPATITEPGFTGTVAVGGVNASTIHLQPSNLTNPANPQYGINATGAWGAVGGANVVVAVNDTLFDLFHPDLLGQIFDDNIDLDGNGVGEFADANGNGVPDIFDPELVTLPPDSIEWAVNGGFFNDQSHSTAVSGIILAALNGSDAVGIAPQSRWIPDSGLNTDFSLPTRYLAKVINNSWGSSGRRDLLVPTPTEVQNWRNAWLPAANHPAISQLVNSAGNGRNRGGVALWQNTNTRAFNPFRQVISVAAAQRNGDIEVYSTPGPAVLVAAPVNSNLGFNTLTSDVTDLTSTLNDDRGYNDGNLTPGFNGTSAAAPMVSGVVALMLEANPSLTRRDIQHILLRTAQKNRLRDSDSDGQLDAVIPGGTTELRTSFVATANTDLVASQDPYNTGWFRNGAGHWVSDSFGFGIVDAGAAVAMAQTWTPVSEELRLSSRTILAGTPTTVPAGTLGGLSSLSTLGSWSFDSDLRVEWVEVTLDLNVSDLTDLMVVLRSPSGTRSVLLGPGGAAGNGDTLTFNGTRTLISNQFWDETAFGDWSLECIDTKNPANVQTIANAKLDIYGTCDDDSPLTVKPYDQILLSDPASALTGLAQDFLRVGGANLGQYDFLSTTAIGADSSWGRFAGGTASNLNVDRGLIFTTGRAVDAIGPNDAEDTSTNQGTSGHWITDQLVSASTYDASGLQLVFKANTDLNLQWGFQFGSEEFYEWVGSPYNDGAGIFLAELNADTMQQFETGRPVSGLVNLTQNAYLDNGTTVGTGGPTINGLSRQKTPLQKNPPCGKYGWEYDGGTLPKLNSQVAQLQAGHTYLLVALTADTTDRIYDSGLLVGPTSTPHVLLRSLSPSVSEDGLSNLVFQFERTGALSSPLTVRYNVAGTAVAGSDYSGLPAGGPPKLITFAAGSAKATLTLDPSADAAVEADETVQLTLAAGPGYNVLTTGPVTGTILNDDTSLEISIASGSKPEGSSGGVTSYSFLVNRLGNTSAPGSVSWAVSGSGAIAATGSDFLGGGFPSGTLSFLAGEVSKPINVSVNADSSVESNEGFSVSLSGAVGATLGTSVAAASILNDDGTSLAITASLASKAEGISGGLTPFQFTVTRAGNLLGVSSVNWSVTGTGFKPATASDFAGGILPSGSLSFLAGETSKSLTVNVNADQLMEATESFAVSLSGAVGATVTTPSASMAVTNDDFIGTSSADTLMGTALTDFLNGLGGSDTLTGAASPDLFGFRFGDSTVQAPDRITDYTFAAFGGDRIDLFTPAGGALPAPVSFRRAADNGSAASLDALTAEVFKDVDALTPGDQPLPANGAALVVATNPAIAAAYLIVNDSTAARSLTNDLLINLSGFSGVLPSVGSLAVPSVFLT